MKLVFYECQKLFMKKSILCFLILCLIVNGGLAIHKTFTLDEAECSQIDLSQAYRKLDEIEMDSGILENRIDSFTAIFFTEEMDETVLKEFYLLRKIYERVQELETYDSYLAGIEMQTEKMLKSSLFSKADTYSERNLQATLNVYRRLQNVNIKADFDGGVLLVTENRATDVFIIVVLVLLLLEVFISERESGVWALLKSTRSGHKNLLASKIGTVFLSTVIVIMFFYGTDFFIAARLLGFGDMSRAIQSVSGYFTSALPLSVAQYLVFFFCMKIVGMIGLCCVFIVICMLVKNSIMAGLVGVFTALAEFLFWKNIPVNSWLVFLRQINLTTLVYTEDFFKEYRNMDFFSWPVSQLACGIALAFLCIILGILSSFILYHGETVLSGHKPNYISLYRGLRDKKYCVKRYTFPAESNFCTHISLWRYEFYKLFFLNKGWLVLFLFIMLQGTRFLGTQYFIYYEEFYYQVYSESLKGKLSGEKETYLYEEKKRIETMEEERTDIIQKYAEEPDKMQYYLSRLDIDDAQIDAFERAYGQYFALKELEIQGVNVEYVYQTPWELLLGKEAMRRVFICYGMFVVVMLLILCSCGANEKMTNMNELIDVSVVGPYNILRKKIAITLAVAGIAAVVAFFPDTIKIISTYGVQGMKAPARSYMSMPVFLQQFTLGEIFILQHVICFIAAFSISCMILFLSEKVGNRVYTLLIGTGVFLIPVLIVLLL